MWTLTLFTMEFDIELLYIQIERSEQIIPFKSIRLYIPPDMLPSTVVDAIFLPHEKCCCLYSLHVVNFVPLIINFLFD